MLSVGTLLQCHQPVATAAVGHVVPEVTGFHAVLSNVAPCRKIEEEDTIQGHSKQCISKPTILIFCNHLSQLIRVKSLPFL